MRSLKKWSVCASLLIFYINFCFLSVDISESELYSFWMKNVMLVVDFVTRSHFHPIWAYVYKGRLPQLNFPDSNGYVIVTTQCFNFDSVGWNRASEKMFSILMLVPWIDISIAFFIPFRLQTLRSRRTRLGRRYNLEFRTSLSAHVGRPYCTQLSQRGVFSRSSEKEFQTNSLFVVRLKFSIRILYLCCW